MDAKTANQNGICTFKNADCVTPMTEETTSGGKGIVDNSLGPETGIYMHDLSRA